MTRNKKAKQQVTAVSRGFSTISLDGSGQLAKRRAALRAAPATSRARQMMSDALTQAARKAAADSPKSTNP